MGTHVELPLQPALLSLAERCRADKGSKRWHLMPGHFRLIVAAFDGAQIIASAVLAARLMQETGGALGPAGAIGVGAVAAMLAAALRLALRGGVPRDSDTGIAGAAHAAAATAIAIAALSAAHQLVTPIAKNSAPMLWFALWCVIATITTALLRLGADRIAERAPMPRRVFVLGHDNESEQLEHELTAATRPRWAMAARFTDSDPGWVERLLLHDPSQHDVALFVGDNLGTASIDRVCEHLADFPGRLCLALRAPSVGPVPRVFDRIGNYVVVDIVSGPHGGLQGVLKRIIDLGGAAILLGLLSPLLLVIGVLIRLESPGPSFFRQRRFGIASRPIEVIKFRTMHNGHGDPTGAIATTERDPRVTVLGRALRRTSIDELPQLLNVLKGEMSLVGPRPHPLHMRVGESLYFEVVSCYRARHRVKPGMTGWAQVNGSRGHVDTLTKARRRVELDLWYIENWSLWLDLEIMVRTFTALLSAHAD